MQRWLQLSLRPRLAMIAALAAAMVFPGSSTAFAQQASGYRDIKPLWDESSPDQRRLIAERERLVRDVLNGRTPLEGQARTDFDQYFKSQVFASMASLSNLGKIAEKRREFFRQHLQMTNPPQPVHDHLVQLTFTTMQAISASPQFHPAVRYNAMLIIGELNEVEASGFASNRTPPTPLPAALDFMLTQLRNPNQIDEVRMAAMIGVLRHAEILQLHAAANAGRGGNNVQAQANQKILAVVLPIAQQKDAPEGRSEEGHTWIRRRAIDVLVALGAANPQVASLLDEIIADASAPLSLRCTAARALGQLPFASGQAGYNGAQGAQHLALIAREVCENELAWWESEKKREEEEKLRRQGLGGAGGESYAAMPSSDPASMAADPAGGYYYGGEGYAGGDPTMRVAPEKKPVEYRIERTQRRIKHVLAAVKIGLEGNANFAARPKTPAGAAPENAAVAEGGILKRSPDAEKARIKQVSDAITNLFLVVDKAEPERETMLADLGLQLQKLQALTGAADAGPPGAGGGPPASGPPGSGTAGSGPPSGSPTSGPPGGGPAANGPPTGPSGAAPGPNGATRRAPPSGPPAGQAGNAPAPAARPRT